jgi:hypothetical protein
MNAEECHTQLLLEFLFTSENAIIDALRSIFAGCVQGITVRRSF